MKGKNQKPTEHQQMSIDFSQELSFSIKENISNVISSDCSHSALSSSSGARVFTPFSSPLSSSTAPTKKIITHQTAVQLSFLGDDGTIIENPVEAMTKQMSEEKRLQEEKRMNWLEQLKKKEQKEDSYFLHTCPFVFYPSGKIDLFATWGKSTLRELIHYYLTFEQKSSDVISYKRIFRRIATPNKELFFKNEIVHFLKTVYYRDGKKSTLENYYNEILIPHSIEKKLKINVSTRKLDIKATYHASPTSDAFDKLLDLIFKKNHRDAHIEQVQHLFDEFFQDIGKSKEIAAFEAKIDKILTLFLLIQNSAKESNIQIDKIRENRRDSYKQLFETLKISYHPVPRDSKDEEQYQESLSALYELLCNKKSQGTLDTTALFSHYDSAFSSIQKEPDIPYYDDNQENDSFWYKSKKKKPDRNHAKYGEDEMLTPGEVEELLDIYERVFDKSMRKGNYEDIFQSPSEEIIISLDPAPPPLSDTEVEELLAEYQYSFSTITQQTIEEGPVDNEQGENTQSSNGHTEEVDKEYADRAATISDFFANYSEDLYFTLMEAEENAILLPEDISSDRHNFIGLMQSVFYLSPTTNEKSSYTDILEIDSFLLQRLFASFLQTRSGNYHYNILSIFKKDIIKEYLDLPIKKLKPGDSRGPKGFLYNDGQERGREKIRRKEELKKLIQSEFPKTLERNKGDIVHLQTQSRIDNNDIKLFPANQRKEKIELWQTTKDIEHLLKEYGMTHYFIIKDGTLKACATGESRTFKELMNENTEHAKNLLLSRKESLDKRAEQFQEKNSNDKYFAEKFNEFYGNRNHTEGKEASNILNSNENDFLEQKTQEADDLPF